MIKRNEMTSQKNLLDEYQSAMKQKEYLRSIEREEERKHAQGMEQIARNSLSMEGSQRSQMLNRFKQDLKQDFQDRYDLHQITFV